MINMQTCFERAISGLNNNLRWQIFSCVRKDTPGSTLFTIRWCCQSSRNISYFTCNQTYVSTFSKHVSSKYFVLDMFLNYFHHHFKSYILHNISKRTSFVFRLCCAYYTIVKKLYGTVHLNSMPVFNFYTSQDPALAVLM